MDNPIPLFDANGNLKVLRRRPRVRLLDRGGVGPCWVAWGARGQELWPHAYVYLHTVCGSIVVASRYAWAEANGRDPGRLTVHHTCFEKRCVNPAHLELATLGRNSQMSNFGERVIYVDFDFEAVA